MATARTTGADAQAEELRRRNVAGQTATPVVSQSQIEEKSKEKVRLHDRDDENNPQLTVTSHSSSSPSSTSTSTSGPRSSSPRSPSSRACTRLVSRQLSLGTRLSKQAKAHHCSAF